MTDCLQSENRTLAAIRRDCGQYGEAILIALVNTMIADVCAFFSVGKGMSDEQVRQTSILIIGEFPHFKPDYFKLCFSRAKKGKYGPVYDRIDGQVLIGWLSEFDWEIQEEVARLNENHHKNRKKDELTGHYDSGYLEFLREVVNRHENKIGQVQDLEVDKSGAYKTHQQKQVDQVQIWMRQFDNLYSKYGNPGAIRTITIGKLIMDINKFLEQKIKNRSEKCTS